MIERRLNIHKASAEAEKITKIKETKGVDYAEADKLLDGYRSKEAMERLPFHLERFNAGESKQLAGLLDPGWTGLLDLMRYKLPEKFKNSMGEAKPSEEDLPLINKINKIANLIREQRAVDGEIEDVRLGYRVVSAISDKDLREIINRSTEFGGKNPHDDVINGVCIDKYGASVGEDDQGGSFLKRSLKNGFRTIVFIYDMKDLLQISEEDQNNTSKFVAGYGFKPKPGNELKDSLAGVMTFENSRVIEGVGAVVIRLLNQSLENIEKFAPDGKLLSYKISVSKFGKVSEPEYNVKELPNVKEFSVQLLELNRRLKSKNIDLDENDDIIRRYFSDGGEYRKIIDIMQSNNGDWEKKIEETYPEGPKEHFKEFIKDLDELLQEYK